MEDECLLCLVPKQDESMYIEVDSTEWIELNMRDLIEKHLWPIELSATSLLCLDCCEALNDFHKFYSRIEETQYDRKLIMDTETDPLQEDIHIQPKKHLKLSESDTTKESLMGEDIEAPAEIKLELEEPNVEWWLHVENDQGDDQGVDQGDNQVDDQGVDQGDDEEDNNLEMVDDEENDPSFVVDNSVANYSDDMENDEDQLVETKPTNDYTPIAKPKSTTKPRRSRKKNPNSKPKSPAVLKTNKAYLPRIDPEEYDNFLKENFTMACDKCEQTFEKFRDLCVHFGEVHDEQGYVVCCETKYFNRPLLADHVNVHLNPEYFKCVLCGKVLNKRISLINHLKLHDEKNFSCDKCDKKFIQKYLLDKHLLRHLPPSEKKFSCDDCGKLYASQDLLNLHEKTVHRSAYSKICEICGQKIISGTLFQRHMERHKGVQYSTDTKIDLKTETCDECGLRVSSKAALRFHKEARHPTEKQSFTCHICSKVSPNKRALKKHIQHMHVLKCEFKCTVCGRAFKRSENFKSHMATHTGTPLYSCPWCTKEFNSYSNMHKHRKNAHPVEWEKELRKKYSGNLPPHFKRSTTTKTTESCAIQDEDTTSSQMWETQEVEYILE